MPNSLDPNHRPRLWPQDIARATLLRLAAEAVLLLLSGEDAELMFAGASADQVVDAAHELGCRIVVLTSGANGAVASDRTTRVPVARDPVGAGDGFDAGFLAGHLRGLSLLDCEQR